MKLQEHYDQLRAAAIHKLSSGEAELDSLLDSKQDERRGITLLARPPLVITERIGTILADFQRGEPQQYYYPPTDIHLTILSIISCYSGFSLDLINPDDYRNAVSAILQDARPFTIQFLGLTASPGGIMVQGFPQDEGLNELREKLRTFFRASSLPQSIDQRYSIQTAHATVLRFRAPLLNSRLLLQKLAKYERHFIGSFDVTELELVYNDWYQRRDNTILLEKYSLAP